MKKIKVLFIEPISDLGGVSYFILKIIKNLPENDFSIHFVADGDGELFSILKNMKVINHKLPINYSASSLIKKIFILRELIIKEKFDVIHTHTAKSGLLVVFAKFLLNTKVVYTGHGLRYLQIKNKVKRNLLYLLEKFILVKVDFVTYLSKIELNQGGALHKKQNCKVVPMSLDINLFNNNHVNKYTSRGKYNLPINDYIIGMIGRMVNQKDPDTFLKISKLISSQEYNIKFVWVGEGDLRDKFIDQISQYKLKGKVVVINQVSNNEIPALLSCFDSFLFTSRFEGLPIIILEAMASKIPIIAANVGGIPELIIEEKTGMLFEAGDAEEATQKILKVYRNKGLADTISNNAQNIILENYCPESKISSDFSKIYHELAG